MAFRSPSGFASGERNEQRLVVETLQQRFLKQPRERLIGDRAYDGDPLDAELRVMGVR
jgi:hypothetical protein